MRAAPFPACLLALLLCCPGLALAQTLSPTLATPPAPNSAPAGRAEPAIEKIHHEDKGSRIDELRVGGDTKNITVQPKGNLPSYEVNPGSNDRNPAATDRRGNTTGPNGWKILGF